MGDQKDLRMGALAPWVNGWGNSPTGTMAELVKLLLSAAKRTKWPVRRLSEWRPGAPFAELRRAFAEVIDAHR